MNIMFDQSFPVEKQDLPVTLTFEKVIFVFEDVDAASKIVKARNNPNHYVAATPAFGRRKTGVRRSKKPHQALAAASQVKTSHERSILNHLPFGGKRCRR